jgi:gliding motility-associated-like protein
MYTVEVTSDKGCKAQDSILVTVNIGDPSAGFVVPSAFTPNRDGLNDCFGVKHWGPVKDFEMIIYNRWGQMMFYSTNPNNCWDGTYAGKDLGTATYVYVIKATTICGPVLRKGTIVLVR